MPASIIAGSRITALRLSAVTVVTMSAPRTACAVLAQRTIAMSASSGIARRLRSSLAVAARVDVEQAQFANAQHAVEGNGLELALRAVADQRHHRGCRAAPGALAASADIAAVRSAVVTVSSDSSSG